MIDFPSSPTVGQIVTSDGVQWRWDGTAWAIVSALGTVPCVVKSTQPTAADYGTTTIPLNAIWIQSP